MAAADDSWTGSWQAWANDVAAAWRKAAPGTAGDPLPTALAGFARFAESVARAGTADATPAQAFAEHLEQLAAALPAALDGEWFSLPFMFGGAWPSAAVEEALQGWLETTTGWYEQCLDLPALGPQREWLEAAAAVQRARLREQRAGTALARHYRAAIARALNRFAAWLRDDAPPAVTSLRALFDVWVGIADQAYREQVMQAEFSADFGAHVNAMSARRSAEQALARRLADAAGLPHRAALDEMAEQQAALRREIDALRAELVRLRTPPTARPVREAEDSDPARGRADAAATGVKVDAPAAAAAPAQPEPKPEPKPEPEPKSEPKSKPKSAAAKAAKRRPARERRKTPPRVAAPPRQPARERRAAGGEFDIERILQQGE